MTYASILVTACARPADELALSVGAAVAAACGAQMTVSPGFPDYASDLPISADLPLSPEVADALRALEAAWSASVSAAAKQAAEAAGLAFAVERGPGVRVAPKRGGRRLTLERLAPLSDLTVMAWESLRDPQRLGGAFSALLYGMHAPVLVARGGRSPLDHTAAVAWDNSPEAGRALRASLPLLRKARKVLVLQDPHGLSWTQEDGAHPLRLVDYLALHGVMGVETRTVTGVREGPALLEAAMAAEAGLLVAGAYGHARLREWLFGGATQSFLSTPLGPNLLLAH